MNKKEIIPPHRMNINVMRHILEQNRLESNGSFFMSKDFGVSCGTNNIFHSMLSMMGRGPMLVEDYRFGLLLKGELDVTINLVDYALRPGSMVFLGRGSIGQIHRISPDVEVRGFVISEELLGSVLTDGKPEIIDGRVQDFVTESTEDDVRFIDQLAQTVWMLVRSHRQGDETLKGLLSSVVHYYNTVYQEQSNIQRKSPSFSRGRELFNRFLALVNQHAEREHTVAYYASELCLSQRYLSSIIAAESGQSAKHWIDEAILAHAKVLLHHTTLSISQISDRLHFPNDSFFCKFFRRLTGQTPSAFRSVRS